MCLIATSLEGDKNYIWHWLLLYRDSMVETTTFLIWIEMYWIKSFLLRQSITGEKLVYFFVISLDRNTVECYHKLPQQNKLEIDCRKLIKKLLTNADGCYIIKKLSHKGTAHKQQGESQLNIDNWIVKQPWKFYNSISK